MPLPPPTRREPRKTQKTFDHGQPIATLSLAPLAGVILIVVLILVSLRPPVTHALLVDLPIPLYPGEIEVLTPPSNRLAIDAAGELAWNGRSIPRAQLQPILEQTLAMNVQPSLRFEPAADAPYGTVLEVMEVIRKSGLIDNCFRFADIARYRYYERPPSPDQPVPASRTGCDPYLY